MDYGQLWNSALSQIEIELSRVNFNTWFKNTRIIDYKDGEVTIGVPNEFVKDWLNQKYHKFILRVLRTIHESVRSVVFTVVKPENLQKKAQHITISNGQTLPLHDLYINKDDGLNPRYTFDSFIVGPFNEVAYACSQAVINNLGIVYNPLFVYGNTGLGKTHLMQAIGNTVKKKHPERKVFYTSLEKFYIDLVNSINLNKINAFKEKYRKYDVFIMDDIQFINGKEKTQDELFHLFNSLYEMNKQIIFSSDKHPNLIVGLEDRLRSRFNHGMIVDVNIPSFESRLAILQSKTKDFAEKIPQEVLEFIAETVQGNIRELEGVMTSILGHIQAKQQAVTLADVKTLLKNNVRAKKSISIPEIVKIIADYYHIPDVYIYNKTRRKDVVKPRQIVMYILREDFDISYPMIGERLGGRDHTTVIHSYEKIKGILKDNPQLTREIDDIRAMLV
ncbi:MAG: chromosomal replication initiation protein chromosomal replication initiator protein [Candidatus Parcubacteria bacterium]|jgi:chromosomal replication initiator protein